MPIPSPEPKASKLLNEIDALIKGNRRNINSLDIARLENEAKKLTKATPEPAWVIRGAIAALKRDIDAMRHAFRNAEHHCSDVIFVQMNYAINLMHTGFFAEAIRRMWKIAQKSRDNLKVLQNTKKACINACNLEKAKTVSQWLDKLQPDIPPDTEFYESIDCHLALLASKGLSSEDITACWEIAYRLIERKYANELSLIPPKSIEEDGSLYIEVRIPDTPEATADLNLEIAERLAANFENLMPDVLLITTNPAQKTEVEI